jgi:hypothetical protein
MPAHKSLHVFLTANCTWDDEDSRLSNHKNNYCLVQSKQELIQYFYYLYYLQLIYMPTFQSLPSVPVH